jgi:hypothetical protein
MELKGEEDIPDGPIRLVAILFLDFVCRYASFYSIRKNICDHVLFGENGTLETGILNIRYHLPDICDGRVNLPGLEWPDSVKALFNSNITHFTFAKKVRQCYALMSCSVRYWS